MARLLSVYPFASVAYADIFDYPLTPEELRLWCIKKTIRTQILTAKGSGIEYRYGFYFLRGRKSIISQRKKRLRAAVAKWRIARSVATWLRLIPTIQLVGVTGGLAMNNVKEEDDIDLFIITSSGALWISRMFAVFMVGLLGRRRKPGELAVANKICLNMFMAAEALEITKKEQDLFAAHEVLQMVPLWEKAGMYKRFLDKNKWVKEFLPNAWKHKMKNEKLKMKNSYEENSTFYILHFTFRLLELFARFIQLLYMRGRRTNEVVGRSVLRFHPSDARVWVKAALQKRLDRFSVPLDKIFYTR